MEIITYTIGVLIGLVPILVDLGPSRAPAQVLLDGKVVCSVTAEAPGCVADLGTAPRLNPSVVLAGTPAGLFARVGESPWKRIDEAPGHVTAIAVDGERRVFVGTARHGVFVDRFLR